MKQIKGILTNFTSISPLLGRFCIHNYFFKRNKILECDRKPFCEIGVIAYIIPKGKKFKTKKTILEVNTSTIPFIDGDIINITKTGIATVVWEANSEHHALYVTDLCNSKCIMCPQTDGSSNHYEECLQLLDIIDLKKVNFVGITGGEPTLNINKLVEILNKIAKKSPHKKVHILTNGRLFTNPENVAIITNIKKIDISFGIPLYSSVAEEHDYIVSVDGAFNETIQGIYNLGIYNQQVEIRIVVLRQNYTRLKLLANYIYRNMPFVTHIAIMGMEYHGNAEVNYNLVSIDPFDYKVELFKAVREFVRYNMIVDVYNIPLCLADDRIKSFCRDSISTWKKCYLPQCDNCRLKLDCCGVFETSFINSPHILPK